MADGGGGEGADGGGSAYWQPIFHRVEAMVTQSQEQAKSLAADREAADRVQRESWEAARRLQRSVEELQAAAREKDAEMDRLRAEAADARKKLQADESRKIKWEAAYVELLLGANQKLAELRDGNLEHSRTCAETPNIKGVESCAELSQNTMDQAHVASDIRVELRKLKEAYETLSSNKDKEVSMLLSEKDSVRNQLDIMQQEYAALLKQKEVEAAQATEAALKLQQTVDELKVLAQKKDDEIGTLRGEAVGAKKKLHKIYSLVKDKDDEIQRLKGRHRESVQMRSNDTNETHKKSRCGDPALTISEIENGDLRHTLEEDSISETKIVENNEHDETTQKRRRASSMTNDDEKSGSNEDDDEQIGSGEDVDKQRANDGDGDEQSASDEDGDEHIASGDDDGQSRSDEHDEDGDNQRRSDEDVDEQIGSDEDGDGDEDSTSGDDDGQSRTDEHKQNESEEETTNNLVQKPPVNSKRKRDACSAQIANGKSHDGSNGVAKRRWSNKPPPSPLRRRRLVITDGQRSMVSNGNWAQYVNDVKESLADQPDKRKEFKRFLSDLKGPIRYRFCYVIEGMDDVLDGHPELIRRLNEFLPNQYHIGVEKKPRFRNRGRHRHPVVWRQSCNQAEIGSQIEVEEKEKQLPEEEQLHQPGVPRPCGQLPSASPSASAAAGLVKLKKLVEQPKREQRLILRVPRYRRERPVEVEEERSSSPKRNIGLIILGHSYLLFIRNSSPSGSVSLLKNFELVTV